MAEVAHCTLGEFVACFIQANLHVLARDSAAQKFTTAKNVPAAMVRSSNAFYPFFSLFTSQEFS